ncbi:unnamed protein product [Adineta ricciae]|uniref:G-protein coupled receptors family 1 profile domain-containing protein n=1 Tax=Adineta ricciae TaxID=249248 RepID=A0A816DB56_ADIRI|nr:unnamed protein product [Adineta ricciae]
MVSLSEVTPYFSIYGFFFTLIFGTVGGIFNLLTFSSQDFRTKSCVFYLICSSLADLLFINVGIILRFSTEYFGNTLVSTSDGVCKARAYLLICLPTMAAWCVVLAAFDRFASASSSGRLRQFNSISFARRSVSITMTCIIASSSFHPFIFKIRNGVCAASSGFPTTATALYAIIFSCIMPCTVVITLGSMTWLNVRKSQQRVTPMENSHGQSTGLRRLNRQLFILVFLHAAVISVLTIQRNVTYTYNVLTSSVQKSVERQTVEYFIIQVSTILYYTNFGLSFYVYYGSSSMFRQVYWKSVKQLLHKCCSCCKCK